ncbi:ectonucleotide pyrophosphatase/phosphodiesterase [Shewanella sp. KT0246]|uniref:alkaline phosphatase family protein n=1 Tax=Shewanella sp. KT0246 TaxID=2815912 RepID=UPI001BB84493|nr:ectonucleotide pyrophosphatase/phosphodiesterase [Shewanella sp. KT0246]GIU53036.1 alkaline phosphatase family protein [Shewanella sp. KT0246]
MFRNNKLTRLLLATSGLLFSLSIFAGSKPPTQTQKDDVQPIQQYVLLVSIDGYHHNYNELHSPKNINQFADKAATVKSFIPSFPTVTFPNHLTLVTGLYPANHGIISNRFYNPVLEREYAMNIHDAVTDGQFYQGTPLWSLARQQGLKSATYFWPGSEAEIAGFRPNYWLKYDGRTPNEERVQQVIDWFNLPVDERPQFVTLYFSDVDSAGHHHGPEAQQTYDAVQYIDKMIGDLLTGLDALPFNVNVIITSDHGMAKVDEFDRIYTDKLIADNEQLIEKFTFNNDAAFSLVTATGKNKTADLLALKLLVDKVDGLEFYLQKDIPTHLHFTNNPSIGDAIIISNNHYITSSDAKPGVIGKHGYDPRVITDMNTVLYAQGPAFKNNVMVEKAENIHLYPLIAEILGLTITEKIDGDLTVLSPLLSPQLTDKSS